MRAAWDAVGSCFSLVIVFCRRAVSPAGKQALSGSFSAHVVKLPKDIFLSLEQLPGPFARDLHFLIQVALGLSFENRIFLGVPFFD